MTAYHSVVVTYTGLDQSIDLRVVEALAKTGVISDGSGYYFFAKERELVFYSHKPLSADKVSNIRRILRNIRRWKRVTRASISLEEGI